MEVCRRGPGSLLYDLYGGMHIVFNIPVRFKGNFEGKIFVYIISESHPIRFFFCAEGGWAVWAVILVCMVIRTGE
jgi:hypothetical protein